MKPTNLLFQIVMIISIALLLADFANAQKKEEKNGFDAKLAEKVGADKYGMRKYVLCLLKTGPNDANYKGDERQKIFDGHLANIQRLAKEGKMALAGPFDDPEKKYRGLFIFAVETVDEAKALSATDPAIKAGILIPEFTPWYGSAALMLVEEFHLKVAKESF